MKSEFNLLWIDLEMTGLDVRNDFILEIASIVTDAQLTILAEGPNLVIHQPDSVLESMNDWCKKQHNLSGLTDAVKASTTTLTDAQQETLTFIKQYFPPGTARLCGNSIWQDRLFLSEHMPTLTSFINYRLIDVSSIKEIIKRWYPESPYIDFPKTDTHRALIDIRESIEELKNYRTHFFIP